MNNLNFIYWKNPSFSSRVSKHFLTLSLFFLLCLLAFIYFFYYLKKESTVQNKRLASPVDFFKNNSLEKLHLAGTLHIDQEYLAVFASQEYLQVIHSNQVISREQWLITQIDETSVHLTNLNDKKRIILYVAKPYTSES